MSHANQYVAFGTGSGANTMSNASFVAAEGGNLVPKGFQSGIAKSQEVNTLMRILSVGVAALAQFAADYGSYDMNDDGNVANFGLGLKSALDARYTPVPAKISWVSAEQTVPTTTGITTVSHGQASTPSLVQVWLRCKTSEGGYSVGDELLWNAYDNGATDRIMTLIANIANVMVNWQSVSGGAPAIRNTSGSIFTLTPSNWRVVIRAFWF